MLRAAARAAARRPPLRSATASAAATLLPRALSTKVIAHCVGPDRVGVLKDMTLTVLGLGGKISDARAVTLDGTFSATATVELPDDSCNLAWALQTKMPDYLTVLRPDSPFGASGDVFGRIDVNGAASAGSITMLTDHMASRGISFATFRVSQGTAPVDSTGVASAPFNATATLYSAAPVDMEWLEREFAELGEKLDVDIRFIKTV